MSDLIDRQALRSAMYHEAMEKDSKEQKWDSGCWIRYKMFTRVLESMPSVQPEIIRCKDCKFKNHYQFPPKYDKKGYCEKHEKIINEIDYCSWAERRIDE